jgi:hypothetical protein
MQRLRLRRGIKSTANISSAVILSAFLRNQPTPCANLCHANCSTMFLPQKV